ncbi:MAG: YbhN family protein, partial [Planctomycetota bacterium]
SGAIDFPRVASALQNTTWISQTLATLFCSIAIITARWWLLLRVEQIEIPLTDALKLTLVGHFWNNILPGAVTGDVVKMYYLGRKAPDKKAEAYATVMIDRVIGLAALVYLAFFAALANLDFVFAPGHGQLKLTFYGNAFLALGFTVGIFALVLGVGRRSGFAEKIRGSSLPGLEGFRRGYRTLIRLGERPGILFLSFALGLLSHSLLVLVGITSARALGETSLGISTYGFIVPVGLFVNSIPIGLPGGLGVGEASFKQLFLWAGAAETLGAGVMILLRIGQFAWGLVGGVVYIFDRKALAPAEG